MPRNISRKPRLAIISDTAMYTNVNTFVYEPVLREVVNFAHLFNDISWLGFGYLAKPPLNSSDSIPSNIKLVKLSPSGGNSMLDKLKVFTLIPNYIVQIIKVIYLNEIIHVRGPSIPALVTTMFSFLFPQKIFWHKYAGSWSIKPDAISYSLQRWLLKRSSNQKIIISELSSRVYPHISTWENACLSNHEIKTNKQTGLNKLFSEKMTFCFIGRFDSDKGFFALLDAFKKINQANWINKLHCVGGSINSLIKDDIQNSNVPILLHGSLSREKLDDIYKESHFIILPSNSEGFPKVLMEAASFGCIPIVSPLDSILAYFNNTLGNAIVLSNINSKGIQKTIINIKNYNNLDKISLNAMNSVSQFSYEVYNERIESYILKEYYKKK